ncbi:LOW QUALITY PROTEIN: hypothetical protein U9M48_012475, partial [Paspalum notatum var. saurae]
MSTRIFAALLNKIGAKARQYDAFAIGFITTDDFTNADILEATYPAIAKRLHGDWIIDPAIPIVTGFLGKGWRSGAITTLGRGGSDLTATTIGKALGLREIQVWKDVDGVLTCDPNIHPKAKPVPYLTFDEAAELAYFGAQVLHPQSMRPAREGDIPVRVKNSYNRRAPGTLITKERDMSKSVLTSIVLKSNVTMLDIVSTRMLGQYGFLAKVFSIFEDLGISVDCVATSEVSISLTLDPSKLWSCELVQQKNELDDVIEELEKIAVVHLLQNRSIISLIGNVQRSSLILEKAFNVLRRNGVNVQMISQGASKVNISLIVHDSEAKQCVQALHSAFFENSFLSEVDEVDALHDGFMTHSNSSLPLFSLNFGVITLILKIQEANQIQQYRLIYLLNVSFKIFTKAATIRINSNADHLVSPTQSAFMRGRNILEGVVNLHEIVHELHRRKQSGVIFKIDFEKTYDKVRRPFLLQTLRMKGFSPKWITWVRSFISGGCGYCKENDLIAISDPIHPLPSWVGYPDKFLSAINVNDEVGPYFQTKKGLRQGDPLSPVLFILVADMLATLIKCAKADGQYADDTILFMDHDLEKACNMKLLLCAFEQLFGLKINFHKSEVFYFGAAQEAKPQYIELFGCNLRSFPMRYLGIPIHYRKLSNADWKNERFQKRLNSWKGKHHSTGGRLTLINSVLSSLSMYMMSFFAIPKGVLKKLDYFRKYRLTKWDILCQPKDQGGLGIHNLDIKNTTLLSKWLFRLLTTEGTWQQMLRNKYLESKPLSQSSLMKVKQDFLQFVNFIIRDGSHIRFWEDRWLGDLMLREQYPCLCNIARDKYTSVASSISTNPRNLSWRRDLMWNNLLPRIANIVLNQDSKSPKVQAGPRVEPRRVGGDEVDDVATLGEVVAAEEPRRVGGGEAVAGDVGEVVAAEAVGEPLESRRVGGGEAVAGDVGEVVAAEAMGEPLEPRH